MILDLDLHVYFIDHLDSTLPVVLDLENLLVRRVPNLVVLHVEIYYCVRVVDLS